MKLSEFYSEQSRVDSAEITYGTRWRTAGFGPWVVSWLKDTGELVAFYLVPEANTFGSFIDEPISAVVGWMGGRIAEGNFPPVDEARVLGNANSREELEARIAGWEAHEDDDDGLLWLDSRMHDAG